MPSRRVSTTNQIKLLIAGAILAGPRRRSFSIHDAAKHAGIAIGQARYSTRFFVEAGLWVSMGNAVYTPTPAGREFGVLWEASKDRARLIINSLFRDMWFYTTLCRELADGPVRVEDLETALLVDGGGHEQHIKLIKHLIEWQVVAYLIELTPDGKVKVGQHLTLEAMPDAQPPSDEPESASAADDYFTAESSSPEQEGMPLNMDQAEQVGGAAPQPPPLSLMAQLLVEALVLLSPDDMPQFVRALGVLSQGNQSSVLHRS